MVRSSDSFKRRFRFLSLLLVVGTLSSVFSTRAWAEELQIGLAQVEITPPDGFPISGYYYERLATGAKDPLWAKAIVFQQGEKRAAWVACDVTGLGIDLSTTVRKRASEATGIPASHIVLTASHSHTGPDYYRALYWHLGPDSEIPTEIERQRARYAGELVNQVVSAIVKANDAVSPVQLASGSVIQQTPVSFCRRFLMKDGSVKNAWSEQQPVDALRATAPIDPEITLLKIQNKDQSTPVALLSTFALHLNSVGGLEWSGDYPYFIEQSVRQALGPEVISLFGTGACGDINPAGYPRLSASKIGTSLGQTITAGLEKLRPVEETCFQVRTKTVPLDLEEVTPEQVQQSLQLIQSIASGEKAEFFDHVIAYKRLGLDHMRNKTPVANASQYISLGLSRTWKGIGPAIPTEVTVMTIGIDTAYVFLPGEIFTELGQSIKHLSPFPHTHVVTLAQAIEMINIPNRQAYSGGGYEVINSFVQAGSGEKLMEAAIQLLKESATEQLNRLKTE